MDETPAALEGRFGPLLDELMSLRVSRAEREQELSCIEAISELARREPEGDLVQRMVEIVPRAFFEPVAARVSFELSVGFETSGFRKDSARLQAPILVNGQTLGALEVHRLGEAADEAPWSFEKRRFLMLAADRFGEVDRRRVAAREQEAIRALVERSDEAIRKIAVNVLRVWEGVLLVPIVGVLDEERAFQLIEGVGTSIVEDEPYFVILDITGVLVVDGGTADGLIKTAKNAALLGITCILTGVQPKGAWTLVELNVDTDWFIVCANIRAGLRECLIRMPDAVKGRASKNR